MSAKQRAKARAEAAARTPEQKQMALRMTKALFRQTREGYRPGLDAHWNDQAGYWEPVEKSPEHEHASFTQWRLDHAAAWRQS